MNRSLLIAGVFLAAAGGAVWLFAGDDLVADDVRLAAFDGGQGLISMPFTASQIGAVSVSVSIDFDSDGIFAESEAAGEPVEIVPRKGARMSVPVALATVPAVGTRVRISVGDEVFERTIKEVVSETDLLDLSSVTNPEESMKGLFGTLAYAQEARPTEAGRITPDIGQKIAECAPTSAANSIISLADEHGANEQMPSDSDLINELKGDMGWTPENGVLPDAFVAGKNIWAARHGLPIRTEKVGDQHGRGTLETLLDAMGSEQGAAAEIRMKFADASGKTTGGHMVTLTGVRMAGGKTYIEVSDPRTPEGSDTYEVRGNRIVGYPYRGLAILSWGFVQRWEGSPTGVALEPMTDAEIEGIEGFVGDRQLIQTIHVGNRYIPLAQVHVSKGEECDKEPHYHANNGSATATDGTVMADPGGCGYGKVSQVPVVEIPKPTSR